MDLLSEYKLRCKINRWVDFHSYSFIEMQFSKKLDLLAKIDKQNHVPKYESRRGWSEVTKIFSNDPIYVPYPKLYTSKNWKKPFKNRFSARG